MLDSFDPDQPQQSIRQFIKTSASEEEKAHFCLSAGCLMEKRQDFEAALICYSEGFSLNCEKANVQYFLNNNSAFCLNQLGQYEQAELLSREAISINPNRHNAYKNLGIALQGNGNFVGAVQLFLKAIEVCPVDPRALMHLEVLFRDHPQLAREIPAIEGTINGCRQSVDTARRSKMSFPPAMNN